MAKEMSIEQLSKESDAISREKQSNSYDVEKEVGIVEEVQLTDRVLERKLLQKFDLHILPLLAVMYLFK